VPRPVIGLVTQTLEPIPGKLPLCWVMGQCYVRALTAAGAVPWPVPCLAGDEPTLREIYERLDGLLMTGGVDIDPSLYGQPRHPRCDRGDPARDWAELLMIRWARADGKPVLGVCRGIQAINVACGGDLYQDIAELCPGAIKHDYFPSEPEYGRDYLAHPVRVEAGSQLARLLGAEELTVNSMHHQGIRRLAPGLRPTAFAPDGLVEGVEPADGGFLVGVQWHPEELAESSAPMHRLFAALVAAAGVFARPRLGAAG
jgi:putative glutamine amidotransferase